MISEKTRDLTDLNEELENRVVLRTKEIDKLNSELKSNIMDLEIANKDLESFSYTASHDLRAPLRNIKAFIGLLEKKSTNLSEESVKYLTTISKLADKMALLIEDLLAFSTLGKKGLEDTTLNMNKLLADALESVNIHEWNSNTRLLAGDLLPAHGDYTLLKQVWVNLISNAVKYSRTTEHPVIEIGSYRERNENIYFVKDNGVGFDMEYYDKLFKVFQRLHSASEFEGIGIGLATVQRIVMRHDGKIWAEAKEGRGATFFFTLPVNANPAR